MYLTLESQYILKIRETLKLVSDAIGLMRDQELMTEKN